MTSNAALYRELQKVYKERHCDRSRKQAHTDCNQLWLGNAEKGIKKLRGDPNGCLQAIKDWETSVSTDLNGSTSFIDTMDNSINDSPNTSGSYTSVHVSNTFDEVCSTVSEAANTIQNGKSGGIVQNRLVQEISVVDDEILNLQATAEKSKSNDNREKIENLIESRDKMVKKLKLLRRSAVNNANARKRAKERKSIETSLIGSGYSPKNSQIQDKDGFKKCCSTSSNTQPSKLNQQIQSDCTHTPVKRVAPSFRSILRGGGIVQDRISQEISIFNEIICELVQKKFAGPLSLEDDEKLIQAKEMKAKLAKKLNHLRRSAINNANARRRQREMKGVIPSPGRPPIECEQPGLHEAIKELVNAYSSSKDGTRAFNCTLSLAESHKKLLEKGFTMSRSTLYYRFLQIGSKDNLKKQKRLRPLPMRLSQGQGVDIVRTIKKSLEVSSDPDLCLMKSPNGNCLNDGRNSQNDLMQLIQACTDLAQQNSHNNSISPSCSQNGVSNLIKAFQYTDSNKHNNNNINSAIAIEDNNSSLDEEEYFPQTKESTFHIDEQKQSPQNQFKKLFRDSSSFAIQTVEED